MNRLLSPFVYAYQAVVDPQTNATLMNRLFWPLIAALVLVIGFPVGYLVFSSSPPRWGVEGYSGVFVKDGVPYDLTVQPFTRDDHVYCVIVGNDLQGSAAGGSEGSFAGKLHTNDGRLLTYSCITKDGIAGSVKVEDENFDLAKGGVFLVSTKDKKTKVEQLSIDMTKLDGGPIEKKLEALGETVPRIGAFLKEAPGVEQK